MSGPHRRVIGVDMGGTTIKAAMVSDAGEVSHPTVVPTLALEGPDTVLSEAARAVREVMSADGGEPPSAVGVGMPGIVSAIDGLVRRPPNFARWGEVDVSGYLRGVTGMPVVTENDANCAALAEARFGAGKGRRDFIFVIWGTGVGGGIILDGKVFRGPGGGAGEIGHVTIDRNGPLCRCGNRGCIEAYIGQRYLSDRASEIVKRELEAGRRPAVLDLAGGELSKIEPALLSRAAEAGDATSRAILEEAGTMLGTALSTIVNIMDIPAVIVGGGISAAPDFVFRAAADEMRSRVLTPHRASVSVERAALGNRAGIIGAASLVL